jgi:diketogulonate reductase-like aldo/keto reductase
MRSFIMFLKIEYEKEFKICSQDIPNLLEDETLIRIGKKYSKTPAQVCLRWHYQRGFILFNKYL